MFNWFRLFNQQEFLDLELVSYEFDVELEGVGTKNIMIAKGTAVSIFVDGIFLSINLNGRNPFRYNELAVYLDENEDVWLGIYK
jgi:hypothetical protein